MVCTLMPSIPDDRSTFLQRGFGQCVVTFDGTGPHGMVAPVVYQFLEALFGQHVQEMVGQLFHGNDMALPEHNRDDNASLRQSIDLFGGVSTAAIFPLIYGRMGLDSGQAILASRTLISEILKRCKTLNIRRLPNKVLTQILQSRHSQLDEAARTAKGHGTMKSDVALITVEKHHNWAAYIFRNYPCQLHRQHPKYLPLNSDDLDLHYNQHVFAAVTAHADRVKPKRMSNRGARDKKSYMDASIMPHLRDPSLNIYSEFMATHWNQNDSLGAFISIGVDGLPEDSGCSRWNIKRRIQSHFEKHFLSSHVPDVREQMKEIAANDGFAYFRLAPNGAELPTLRKEDDIERYLDKLTEAVRVWCLQPQVNAELTQAARFLAGRHAELLSLNTANPHTLGTHDGSLPLTQANLERHASRVEDPFADQAEEY